MPRRRKRPLLKFAARAAVRLVLAAHHWAFAPVAGAVRGKVNWAEWGRALAVAILPALVSGTGVWGLIALSLTTTVADASNIFLAPWIAAAATGTFTALASRCHRVHDGREPLPTRPLTSDESSTAVRYGRA